MSHRTNHGNDRKLRGERKVWENIPDGVRPVPDGVAAPVERDTAGRVTSAGAAELARMRWEAAKLPDFGEKVAPWLPPAPELAPFDDARRELLTHRRQEIHVLTGGVDSGVGTQIRAWAYIVAAGEYWASKFFSTGDAEAFQKMVSAFKAASTEDAKLRDAAVWSAAARAEAKKKSPDPLYPWLSEPDEPDPKATR